MTKKSHRKVLLSSVIKALKNTFLVLYKERGNKAEGKQWKEKDNGSKESFFFQEKHQHTYTHTNTDTHSSHV